MPADLGAKINMRKRAIRIDPDIMEDVGTKWGNKRDRVGFKIRDAGNKAKEITLNKFFLGDPELFSMVIDNCVLVQVAIDNEGAGRSGEEVGKEGSYRYL